MFLIIVNIKATFNNMFLIILIVVVLIAVIVVVTMAINRKLGRG